MRCYLMVVFFGCFGSSLAQCPGCDCFKVKTTLTTLDELISNSPLYSQVASNSSQGAALDSVCLALNQTNVPNNAVVEMVVTFTNGSISRRASIQTPIKPGSFLVVGPTRSYKDFILGKPCAGTYVVYRCIQTGTCVTDINKVDVFIASSKLRQHQQSCIDKGIAIARKNFPGLGFYSLPKTVCNPCQPV